MQQLVDADFGSAGEASLVAQSGGEKEMIQIWEIKDKVKRTKDEEYLKEK